MKYFIKDANGNYTVEVEKPENGQQYKLVTKDGSIESIWYEPPIEE